MPPSFESLLPGTVFSFYGLRRGFLRRRDTFLGRILAKEPDRLILHVRTLRPTPSFSDTTVHVGFMPIAFALFLRSLHRVHGVGPPIDDFWPVLATWRDLSTAGTAGAFSVPLHEAEDMAWQTVPTNAPGGERPTVYLEAAYPVRANPSAPFTVVRALTIPLHQGSA